MSLISLEDIQKNSSDFDAETTHLKLKDDVDSGKYSSYIEALLAFIEENDIDIDPENIKKYITSTLLGILEREAQEKGLMKNKKLSKLIDEFF